MSMSKLTRCWLGLRWHCHRQPRRLQKGQLVYPSWTCNCSTRHSDLEVGGSLPLSEKLSAYGEVSFMTSDDDNYGTKFGFTYDF